MNRSFRILFCFLFFCINMIAGCGPSGPKLAMVAGVVKVQGKPASGALVFMHRDGRNALSDPLPYGTCAEDGTFKIETPGVGVGAQEGEYKITLVLPDMNKPEDGNGQRPDALNGAYDKVEGSKIRATIKAGKNEMPQIDLIPGPVKPRMAADQNLK